MQFKEKLYKTNLDSKCMLSLCFVFIGLYQTTSIIVTHTADIQP